MIPSPTSAAVKAILPSYARWVPARLNIVEIGVYQGGTLVPMAEVADSHVYGIDPWEDGHLGHPALHSDLALHRYNRENTRQNLELAGVRENVTLIQGFATEVGNTWHDGPVGLWFHDGARDYDTIRRDISAWLPHWDWNATVVFDDYDDFRVRHAIRWAAQKGILELEVVLAERLAVCSVLK